MNNYPNYTVEDIDNLAEMMLFMQKRYVNRYAFFRNNEHITYQTFFSDVACFESHIDFQEKMIGIALSDTYHFAIAYFATILSGNIAVLLPSELSIGQAFKIVPYDILVDEASFADWLIGGKTLVKNLSAEKNKCCTILFSSGTTSTPKGIMLSSFGIASDVVAGMQKYEYPQESRFINIIPLSHAFGLVCDLIAPLYSGGEICCLNNRYELFKAMKIFRPTMLNLPPNVVQSLSSMIEEKGTQEAAREITGGCLIKILSGGAGTDAYTINKLREFGIRVYGCYGLSECSPCVSVNRDDFYRDGSSGVPLDCNSVLISENSEIIVVGKNVMLGYYPNITEDMRFHTGDLGYFDSDGFLWITGRVNDLIVLKNGTKIMPQEVEKLINEIGDVVESLVLLSENTRGDQFLKVIVVLQDLNSKEVVVEKIKALPFPCAVTCECQMNLLKRNMHGKIERKFYE